VVEYVVVGSGFSGAVVAERIARVLGKEVLVIEKRNHVGGNAFDGHNAEGVWVHWYGPHIFHTKLEYVWNYLSLFTEWRAYEHRVLGWIDGRLVPIPFNLRSLHALFPDGQADRLEQKLTLAFGAEASVPILRLRETEDAELKALADFIYEKVFYHYTLKQWGLSPEQLDPHVTGRVPVRISWDDRYFRDPYQGIPKNGYASMFENMLDHPRIRLMLGTDAREVLQIGDRPDDIRLFGAPFSGKIVYTGKIDELFGYRFGELPYRSLRFEFETVDVPRYQPCGTVNYPNDHDYTRVTEFKHLTGQTHPKTTIAREYPQAYERNTPGRDVPYYPIPRAEHRDLYERYAAEARRYERLILLGRLAEYRYYDMDACVAKALRVFAEKIAHV